MGQAIEPALAPLGFDWRIGVSLIASFAAREVFVANMAIITASDNPDDADGDDAQIAAESTLLANLAAQQRRDGTPLWTVLTGVTVLVWFVLAMQCLSTVAVVYRETRSWRFAGLQILWMNGLAYVACLVVAQSGRLIG